MKFRLACLWLSLLSTTNAFVVPSFQIATPGLSHREGIIHPYGKSHAATSLKLSLLEDLPSIIPNDLVSSVTKVLQDLPTITDSNNVDLSTSLQQLEQALESATNEHASVLMPFYNQAVDASSSLSPPLVIALSSLVTFWLVSSVLSMGEEPPPSKPYPLYKYDATAARAYFDSRFLQVLSRSVQVGLLSCQFGLNLLKDYFQKTLDENAEVRAVELAQLLTRLGPSFIKIGQSLSIRTDLLSPPYVRGLQTLQDQVPPFDSNVAKQILQQEWGCDLNEVLSDISPEPVAAASLGQVYKATTRDGKQVAIKVQRPNIMNQIALDMYLLREVAPIVKRLFNLNTDTVGTVDAWGTGFVNELDYISEAKNAEVFMESVQTTPLANVVFAPPIVQELTTDKVLTTEWVDGERLDKSSNEDITILCSIAMNTYLTMMLETGLLHCDPHPGNLLRTTDGRLCILDWGMVTHLDKNLQLTLIEHMAHLTSADYKQVPKDLLLLGFIPPDKADLIRDSGVVETLADIYGAWTKGGGAATINVNKVIAQLQDLTATRGNLFQIPPYFAYIAKSFSVLEGIGLSNDKQYSIINECLPYVSKRLLTDHSSRTGGALGTFIFGPEKNDLEKRIIDYGRVEQLVTGFGDYTTSASGQLLGSKDSAGEMSRTALLENLSEQVLDLVVSEEETPFQSIIVEQMAKIISSTSRSLWTELRERSGKLPSGRTVLGTIVDPLGLWRTSPVVRMSELDTRTIEMTRNLVGLMQQQMTESGSSSNQALFDVSTLTREEALDLSVMLTQKIWDRRVGVLKTSNRLAKQLIQLTADKLERGEREVLTIPTETTFVAEESESTNTASGGTPAAAATVATTHANYKGPSSTLVDKKQVSTRLQTARRLLADIENDSSSWSMPSQEHEASM